MNEQRPQFFDKRDLGPCMLLPREIAGRVDLSPTDKLVWTVLADFCPAAPGSPEDRWIAPGMSLLARKSALSVQWVRRSLRHLEAAGLIRRRVRPGKRSEYTILDPPPLEPDMAGALSPRRQQAGDPETQRHPPRNPATPTPKLSDPPVKIGKANSPPPPPRTISPPCQEAEEEEEEGSARKLAGPRIFAARKCTAGSLEEVATLEIVAKAYREARHGDLPAAWIATVLADCRAGAAGTWKQLTAADLRVAYKALSGGRRLDFAPWHGRNSLLDRLSAEAAGREAAGRREAAAAAQVADAQAREDQAAAQRAAWERCTPERQAELTAQAQHQCRRFRGPQKPAVVQTTATFLAWQAERSPA